jgi:hypothetical protein
MCSNAQSPRPICNPDSSGRPDTLSFAEPRKFDESDDSGTGWMAKFLLAVLTTVSFSARAELVGTPGEHEIYRYVEKSTCYTIITTIPPAQDEVAAFLPKGTYKSGAHCGRDAQAHPPVARQARTAAISRRVAPPSAALLSRPLPSFEGYSMQPAALHLPRHPSRTGSVRRLSSRRD